MQSHAYPRFATLFPIIHPFTNRYARYGCVRNSADWSKVKEMKTS